MPNLNELISGMSVEEKIGQLTQYNANLFTSTSAEITGPKAALGLTDSELKTVGSVLNFKSPDEVRTIQKKHLEEDRNKIPMLFMMDVIHGFRTIYPIPLALGCSFDIDIVKECSKMAAKEASAGGVQVTFTPMVDYVRDARWGRVMETCGEEPLINSMMGAAQVEAFQGEDLSNPDNIATCVKHFAGYGGAEAGRDYNTVELSERILREYYLPAYKACIDAGTTMVMPSFNSLNGIPSIANSWLLKNVLKDEWNFDGVVISDYNAIGELRKHGIAADKKQAAHLAFDNGCDIEMCSSAYFHHVRELMDEGKISMEQLDAAVMRVLKLKEKLGMFEDPYRGASTQKMNEVCLTKQHREIAKRAAVKSAVLLKNNGVLPFSNTVKKVALIGPMADEHEIIGFWHCNGRNEESVTVYEGVSAMLPEAEIVTVAGCSNAWNDTDVSGFAEAVAAAQNSDIVVLCLGEKQNYSGEGNCRTDIRLPGMQNELAKQVIAANPNTAVVLFNGRPLDLSDISSVAPAILEMWFPGTEGGNAVADLLFGKANPSGKLSMSFPKSVGQCPIYYNHPNTGRPKKGNDDDYKPFCSNYIDCGNLPLYPFGWGLSYSSFEYTDLSLSASKIDKNQKLNVTVSVRNNGKIDGEEVVQLYMHDVVASTVRPIQQLIAFEKVYIRAGEEKKVNFTVDESMLRFWNFDNQLISEPGTFELAVGCADNLQHIMTFELV